MLTKRPLVSFVLGGATVAFGPSLFRPLIVGVVKTGYQVSDFTSKTWKSVKQEATAVHDEATRKSDVEELRAEIAALKAQVEKS